MIKHVSLNSVLYYSLMLTHLKNIIERTSFLSVFHVNIENLDLLKISFYSVRYIPFPRCTCL